MKIILGQRNRYRPGIRVVKNKATELDTFLRHLNRCMEHILNMMEYVDDRTIAIRYLRLAFNDDKRTLLLWYNKNRHLVSVCGYLDDEFKRLFNM